MPLIKIVHIVSFSSEDPIHVANNILSTDTSKKWKCRTPGEKNAVVILQLEKASIITGMDIGNENSAYIEVLVSRSSANDDYKVLLPMSSFMTPLESRQSQNVNKVRMFTKDQLSKPECNEKWDRVKIYCTQPFNKHVQYGLSFINIHTNDTNLVTTPSQMQIGKFIVRPDSPDNLVSGSLFSKKKEEKQDTLTGAAAIRAATSSQSVAKYGSPTCKPKLKTQDIPSTSIMKQGREDNSNKSPKPRNRNEILYSKDEEEPNEKIDKIIAKKTSEVKETKNKIRDFQTPLKNSKNQKNTDNRKKKEKEHNESISSTSKTVEHANKEKREFKRKNKFNLDDNKNKKLKNDRITKPFDRLLEGVTLVISGIQNPDRGNLRTLALSMGAKYKPDWDNSCTHLICAFPNTPKFNQVKGRGKIIKRTWIEDCHSLRKRLPWRRYALDKNDIGKDESEDELWETVAPNKSEEEPVNSDSETNDFLEDLEEPSDTEERLAKLEEQHNKNDTKDENDVYSADTDIDDFSEEIPCSSSKELMDIFEGKTFYIDQHFEEEEYLKLKKYIIAYKGIFVDSPAGDIDVIITTKDNSTALKEINDNSQCVTPNWVWKCHNSRKLVGTENYLL